MVNKPASPKLVMNCESSFNQVPCQVKLHITATRTICNMHNVHVLFRNKSEIVLHDKKVARWCMVVDSCQFHNDLSRSCEILKNQKKKKKKNQNLKKKIKKKKLKKNKNKKKNEKKNGRNQPPMGLPTFFFLLLPANMALMQYGTLVRIQSSAQLLNCFRRCGNCLLGYGWFYRVK